MSLRKYTHSGLRPALIMVAVLALLACATPMPVQEISNARQALLAAENVDAGRFAPNLLERARRLLARASNSLEAGEYNAARELAVEARLAAFRAHQLARREQREE